MQVDTTTVDRIVTRVLKQLRANEIGASPGVNADAHVSREPAASAAATGSIAITANVVTADVLITTLNGASHVTVPERAVVTPAAWDVAKLRRIEIVRDGGFATQLKCAAKQDAASSLPLMIVVRHTDAVGRFWDDVKTAWRRELLGCPDDAAKLAVSEIARGAAARVVILAEQTHRAACLANRNERVKAVVIRDAGDVRGIQKQLRANVWCVDPTGRSWFELKNLMRAIEAPGGAQ